MGLKFGQNIKFQFFFKVSAAFWSRQRFLVATKLACRDILLLVATSVATYCCLSRHRSRCRDILLLVATSVATYCCLSRHRSRHTACRDILPMSRHAFLTAACFFSPTCRGHNSFVLTWIWACEYSLESSLNVECSHEGI